MYNLREGRQENLSLETLEDEWSTEDPHLWLKVVVVKEVRVIVHWKF